MENTLGMRIAQLRKRKGLTQEGLAEILGVSSQAVSKWENDLSCPDIQLLPRLASTLGITVDELLSGKNNEVRLLPVKERRPLEDLTLRVNVNSKAGDKVRVNLPMPLVKVCLELGVDIIPSVTEGMDSFRNFDLNQVMDLAERGLIGRIVEVESAKGDTLEIVVE